MNSKTLLENLPGVGNYYSSRLKKLDLVTIEDLIYHFPFRYDDFSQIEKIRDINPNEKITIQGVVWQIKNVRTRTGKFLTNAQVADESGLLDVIWFNQPYLTKSIKSGTAISLSGKVDTSGPRPKMISPTYEIIRERSAQPTLHTGRLVPIYPETEGLSSKWLRTKIALILPLYLKEISEHLPTEIINFQKLTNLESALNLIHQPNSYEDVDTARHRLAFDELFLMQILSKKRKLEWQEHKKSVTIKKNPSLMKEFILSLPFKLTIAQEKAINQALEDLSKSTPMNRLLEGDVGSGKTVVAAAAVLASIKNGYDALIAAPTEILAFQHYKTLTDLLKPFGVSVGIWTASKKENGSVTCGTHALLVSHKPQRQVGLVVVDEQHRFGVAQRAKLFLNISDLLTPHLLTMTATPIPRTLALTLYGDLDLSVLDEMPKGRLKISTFVVPNKKRADCYRFIEKEVGLGKQAFIVTPFVEPSESMQTVKAAKVEFEKLTKVFSHSRHVYPESRRDRESDPRLREDDKKHAIKLGLLHGKLKSKEKEDIINKFKAGKIDVLVATPVVEVGIDVPNATIIVIESADRFGLAQLHQLRGRVGRSDIKSYCFLFTDSNSENSIKRLKSMEKVYVGFELAEIDLKMRGSGELFGLKQSGFISFKIADLTDHALVSAAQTEAQKLLDSNPNLKNYPQLATKLESLQNQYSQPN